MSVLLIAEHNNKELRPFTLNAVTAASQIDSELHVLVIGHNCSDVAKKTSEIPEVKKVDTKLIVGSSLFGIGWGSAGLCPGPAISSLALLNNYSLNFDKIKKIRGKNYIGHEAEFNLYKKNKFIKTLKPQKRFYPVQEFPTTEAAIYSRGLSDIYIAMSEPIDNSWIFRFHFSPLTPWIWIGSIMAFIGGILSFSHRIFKRI